MNATYIKKILIYTMLVVVCVGMSPTGALAEGDGDLGAPSITIASGTKLLAAGTGMVTQPGTINIDVPLGATVEQVLLYWGGRGTPDDSITVDGIPVTGTNIGFPHSEGSDAYSFRANITGENLVSAGPNTLKITDMSFGARNNGASVLVIIKDGPDGLIEIRDGTDFAWFGGTTLPIKVTEMETFAFSTETFDRNADLILLMGDGTPDRPDRIDIIIDSITTSYDNFANGSDGPEWDTIIFNVMIPAGVNNVSVQLFSDGPTEINSDSLSWVAAALSIEPLPLASIGDYVWNDTNNNGIQEVGEPGVEDVTVNLMNCSGGQLDQTTTDSNGNYLFDGLTPGDYNIHFVLPNGYSFSLMDQLADDSNDSDADPTSGMTICTTLVPGENDMTWDAGIYLLPPPSGTGTPGYWKNHPDAWPVDEITIGGVTYTKDAAIDFMKKPVKKDKTFTMFPHLVSAKLNVLIGNPDDCIAGTIEDADDWMAANHLGSGVKGNSDAWKIGEPLSIELDKYNNGLLCAPHRD